MAVPSPPQSDGELWTLAMSDNTDPEMRARYLAYRVSVLAREKEELERREEQLEARIHKLENTLDKEKMDKIDSAIEFMNNAEFMGKWTWRGIAGFIFLSGAFFGAFKFWKGP